MGFVPSFIKSVGSVTEELIDFTGAAKWYVVCS
jgi:hypothetical protein